MNITRTTTFIRDGSHLVVRVLKSKPYILALILSSLYLVLFQFPFLTTGDTWAETYYEYVHGALANSWQGFFYTGIAGYFNFLPKIISFSYVAFGLPLQYIDYFLRIATILYTIACVSFLAHKYNRQLICSDFLRITLALFTLMTYYHISSFSFINVWYVGFIPMILISLNPTRFDSERKQILYAAYALTVCLTKPSIILLPLVLYRMVKLKEYLMSSIIISGITLQTLLFLTSSFYNNLPEPLHVDPFAKILNVILYLGLLLLKLFKIEPVHLIAVLAATLLVLGLFVVAVRFLGLIRATLTALTLSLVSYTSIYSPDALPITVRTSYEILFNDQMKLQREVLVSFILLLVIFIGLNALLTHVRKTKIKRTYTNLSFATILILMAIGIYRPIDVLSGILYINIDSFRNDLASKTATCMPIPPTPSWVPYDFAGGPTYGWYYESGAYGSCTKTNYKKTIDYKSFHEKINSGTILKVENKDNLQIRSLLIPVHSSTPKVPKVVRLKNLDSGEVFTSKIVSKSNGDNLNFVAFNLAGDTVSKSYNYQLSVDGVKRADLSTGSFSDGTQAYFAYFL